MRSNERLIGTIRRECLDWMIPMTEEHLRSILRVEDSLQQRPTAQCFGSWCSGPSGAIDIPHQVRTPASIAVRRAGPRQIGAGRLASRVFARSDASERVVPFEQARHRCPCDVWRCAPALRAGFLRSTPASPRPCRTCVRQSPTHLRLAHSRSEGDHNHPVSARSRPRCQKSS